MSLLLVDGTNVIMRYASAMVGDPQNPTKDDVRAACEASFNAILECAKVAQATHLIVALDSGEMTWRRTLFPEYKAKRTVSTNEWSNRFNIFLTFAGVFVLRESGFEGDDVIATLAARAQRAGKLVSILSGDSDMLQLASLSCSVFQFGNQKKGEPRFALRTMEWIRAKYDIPSAGHLGVYKALVGEPGDGLPGVPGIGPVKAREFLKLVGVRGSIADDVRYLLQTAERVAQFNTALELVTLKDDVPFEPITPSECSLSTVQLVKENTHA